MRGRFYFADEPPAEAEIHGNLKFSRIMLGDKPCVKAWRGKQGKPFAYHSFRSPEARETWIAEQKSHEDSIKDYKAHRAVEREKLTQQMSAEIQVGTVLSGSWGYDQTNVELWQVVERRGMAVWIKPLCCETVPGSHGFMCEHIRPIPGKYCGDPVKKIIGPHGLHCECYTLSPTDPTAAHYSSHYA